MYSLDVGCPADLHRIFSYIAPAPVPVAEYTPAPITLQFVVRRFSRHVTPPGVTPAETRRLAVIEIARAIVRTVSTKRGGVVAASRILHQ